MLIMGKCKRCDQTKQIIDRVNLCADCIISMRKNPLIPERLKLILKMAINSQYGEIPMNRTMPVTYNQTWRQNVMSQYRTPGNPVYGDTSGTFLSRSALESKKNRLKKKYIKDQMSEIDKIMEKVEKPKDFDIEPLWEEVKIEKTEMIKRMKKARPESPSEKRDRIANDPDSEL